MKLLSVALCCLLHSTTTTAQVNTRLAALENNNDLANKDVIGGALPIRSSRLTRGGGSGRLLKKRVQKIHSDESNNNEERELQGGTTQTLTNNGSIGCRSIIAVGGTKKLALQHAKELAADVHSRALQQDEQVVHSYPYRSEYDDYETDEEFLCEVDDESGVTIPIEGTSEQLSEMRALLNTGTIISSESTVVIDSIDTTIDGGGDEGILDTLDVASMNEEEEAKPTSTIAKLPSGSIKVVTNPANSERKLRRLNRYEGTKKALILRVIDKSNRQPDGNAKYISDKFFGTNGDTVTMKSGFHDCTFGKLNFSYDYDCEACEDDAPGVLEIKINEDLSKITQSQMRSAVLSKAKSVLGYSLPGPFDHVLAVVEDCYPGPEDTCSFAAYAFVNGWFSVYVEDNYKYPAVGMHELGHNLNLAHSGGLDGRTYTDHTCIMGNPLWEDNVGSMCFNPVKNFQVSKSYNGWYDDQDIMQWNSGTTVRKQWSGRLVGVAQYDKNTARNPVVIKMETGNSKDWFIGFNHATGPNKDSVEGRNQVTIYKVNGGDGFGYSHSFLKGKLSSGQTARITNWRDTGKTLTITVDSINTGGNPGYADITITYEGTPVATPNPTTRNPTRQPTNIPTKNPTNRPVTPSTPNPTEDVGAGGDVPGDDVPGDEQTPNPTPNPTSPPTPAVVTTLINFDDVTTSGYASINNGYKGLNWGDGFSVISKDYYAESGYFWGTTSGQYSAFFTGGSTNKFGTISSSSPFSVKSLSVTAAWFTGVTVRVEGFNSSSSVVDTYEVTLGGPRLGALSIDLNFENIYQLRITGIGGTSTGLQGEGPWLAVDDIVVY